MIGGRGGWPIMLADLSLILFVATAVQASHSAAKAEKAGAAPAGAGVAQAFYAAEPGLGDEAQVTILSTYRPGGAVEAVGQAKALAREAEAAGREPRVMVEPGDGSVRAILAYDNRKH